MRRHKKRPVTCRTPDRNLLNYSMKTLAPWKMRKLLNELFTLEPKLPPIDIFTAIGD